MFYFSTIAALLACAQLHGSSTPNPDEMLQAMKQQSKSLLGTEGTFTGEVACWQANYKADRFYEAYRETGNPDYIVRGVEFFRLLMGKLHTSPDGFRGWVGPYVYDEKYSTDVPISDAILAVKMLQLADLILRQEPEKFQSQQDFAQDFVNFSRRDVIGKWDARGTWHDDGPYGFYVTWPMMFEGTDFSKRIETRAKHSRLGYQFNKQTEMGRVTLHLWRITGEEAMKEKTIRIARLLKSRLNLWDGHYTWNYWEPIYTGDLWSIEGGELAHWVGTHPHRHYQINELEFIVSCHESGLVFDRIDMERFAATHDRVMWNQDLDNPAWPKNSDAAVIQAATGSYTPPRIPPGNEKKHEGRPWKSLSPWSEPLQKMYGKSSSNSNPVISTFPSPEIANSSFKMAAVIPAVITYSGTAYAVCSVYKNSNVKIDVIDENGVKVKEVFNGGPPKTWNIITPLCTEKLPPGTYKGRFEKDGQVRFFSFWVTE